MDDFGRITGDMLGEVVEHQKKVTAARKISAPPPKPGQNIRDLGIGEAFFDRVSATAGIMPHTKEANERGGRHVRDYAKQFGKPALFITVTPNMSGDAAVNSWLSTGKSISVDEMDAFTRHGTVPRNVVPERHTRKDMLDQDPAAAALRFTQMMNVFTHSVRMPPRVVVINCP
jgi:hypothetical protein